MRPDAGAKVPVMHGDVTVFFLCSLASGAAFSNALEDLNDAPERAMCSVCVRYCACSVFVMRHYVFRASHVAAWRILTE